MVFGRMANVTSTRFALILLGVLVCLAYANSLWNGFAYDDEMVIVRNKTITRLDNIPNLFTSDYWASRRDTAETVPAPTSGLYRPFVLATYAVNYAAGGLNPVGYHLVNLGLHLLVTWVLYGLALQLGGTPAGALVAAAVFALHPLHTEAVTGVVGRAELSMALGALASLLWGLQGRLWWSLSAFAVALFSKEQAAMVPVLLVVYQLCLRFGGDRGRDLRGASLPAPAWRPGLRSILSRYAAYLLLLVGYLVIRAGVLGGLNPPPLGFVGNPLAYADSYGRVLTALKVAGRYLWLCVWPVPLSADYSYNAIPVARSLAESGVLSGLMAVIALLALTAWAFRRDPRLCFSLALAILTFLPVSNLLIPIGTIMGERLFYLPSAGLCLAVGLGCERFLRSEAAPRVRRAAVAVLVVAGLLLTWRTVLRNRDWTDSVTLFRSAVQVVPDNAKAFFWLGVAEAAHGHTEEALDAYRTAVRLYPDYPLEDYRFSGNLGVLLLQSGKMEEAVEAFKQAIGLNPQWSVLHFDLGLAYMELGRYEQAEYALRQALALNPDHPNLHTGMSQLMLKTGRYAEALDAARAALRKNPTFLPALINEALALERLGRVAEAMPAYERVLSLNPGLIEIRQRLEALRSRPVVGKGGLF